MTNPETEKLAVELFAFYLGNPDEASVWAEWTTSRNLKAKDHWRKLARHVANLQLQAWREGMTEAARIVRQNSKDQAAIHEYGTTWDEAAILKARDEKGEE